MQKIITCNARARREKVINYKDNVFKRKVLASVALTANWCLTGAELTNTSAGTQEVLINPELTAKLGHPLGGIRESNEYQHT